MAAYVILGHWTAEGMEAIDDGPKRLDLVKRHLKKRGAEMRAFYLLMGPYDFLAIVEAKDDQKLAAALLEVAREGHASTETLRAFDEDDYRKIVKNLA